MLVTHCPSLHYHFNLALKLLRLSRWKNTISQRAIHRLETIEDQRENRKTNRYFLPYSNKRRPFASDKAGGRSGRQIQRLFFLSLRLPSAGGECDKNTRAHWYATTATEPPCSSASPLSPRKPATTLAKTIGSSGIALDTPAPRPTPNATR